MNNLICTCGHYEDVHYDGDHFTSDGPFKVKSKKYCNCSTFISDNLKYLEMKYEENIK